LARRKGDSSKSLLSSFRARSTNRRSFAASAMAGLRRPMTSQPSASSPLSPFELEMLPYKSALYRAAYSLLHSRGEAEDAVQETYLQAWKSFQRFQLGSNSRAWMYSILFNVVRHQRRKWIVRYLLTNDTRVFEQAIPAFVAAFHYVTDPEILTALRKLPQSYAQAVILADVEELSYKEISKLLGCPMGTVMSRLNRGRKILRKALVPFAQRRRMLAVL